MPPIQYQSKIIMTVAAYVVVALLLFAYGFRYIDAKHQEKLQAILNQKKTVLELRQEQQNIQLAKQDLQTLQRQSVSPEDLFSLDETLVKEISQLETITKKLDLDLTLSVSGTVAQGAKAQVVSDLVSIPVNMQVRGTFANTVQFLEWLEHASFIVTVRSISLGASGGKDKDAVTANFTGVFYLRK